MADAIRDAIAKTETPYLVLEEATGVSRASIMRFIRGDRTLRLDIADRLALYFGITSTWEHEK